jgi:hypothetical protein
VVALRASNDFSGFDDDGAGHTRLLHKNSGSEQIRGQGAPGSGSGREPVRDYRR